MDKEYSKSKFPNGLNDRTIAEDLKQFFDTKIGNIYSKINEETCKFADQEREFYSCPPTPSTSTKMSAFKTTEDSEQLEIIMSMPDKQCSLDPLPMFLLKFENYYLLSVTL